MDEIFLKAARSALAVWDLDDDLEDLIQDLRLWYLERPSTQEKLAQLSKPEAITTVRKIASQILSGKVLAGNTFKGDSLYSSDAVKQALRGESSNKYLLEILPICIDRLNNRNPGQAEAIRIRYDDGVVPEQGSDNALLVRAVKSLTEEVNVLYLTLNDNEVKAVRPDARRSKGQYSDPTANIALMLIDHPEMRDDYLEVTPIEDLLKGRNAKSIRPAVQRDGTVGVLPVAVVPGAVPARATDADPELEPTG